MAGRVCTYSNSVRYGAEPKDALRATLTDGLAWTVLGIKAVAVAAATARMVLNGHEGLCLFSDIRYMPSYNTSEHK